jgi:Na+-driven multidrug efflux pump
MTTGNKYVIASGVGGMISGAIGAAVASSSDSHPVLKGALVVGALNAALGAFLVAVQRPDQLGLKGAFHNPRFP